MVDRTPDANHLSLVLDDDEALDLIDLDNPGDFDNDDEPTIDLTDEADDLGPTPPEPAAWSPHEAQTYELTDGVAEAPLGATQVAPIVAPWLRTGEGRRANAVRALRRWRYTTLFHAVRLPSYWWRLVRRSPHGLGRMLVQLGRWSTDRETRSSIEAMRTGAAIGTGMAQLEMQHRRTVISWLVFDAVLLVLTLIGLMTWWYTVSVWWRLGQAAVVLPLIGLVGRSDSKPIVERVIYAGAEVPKLTQDLILNALVHSGVPNMKTAVKEHGNKAVRWIKPPIRTKNGYECVLDLPDGATVDAATTVKGAIASGLQRPASTVWLSKVADDAGGHEGRLHIVVTDSPMRSGQPPVWPLADPQTGAFDIFRPVPLGVDYLGELVTITLIFASGIIGALPRMGKSYTLRLWVLAAALDPTVEIHLYDLKGGGDFLGIGEGATQGRGVAHAFRSGSSVDDEAAMLTDLRAMKADMERRYGVIRDIVRQDRSLCPDSKITRELANDPKLGLHPVMLAIDETQVCFADWPSHKEIVELVTDLAKRGPAVGVMVFLATQSVDSTTIPKSISRMAAVRFCLQVTDHVATNQVLGTGATAAGHNAHDLAFEDKGIGYLSGEGADIVLARCALIDGEAADRIVERARRLRERTGRLTGLAAGIGEPDTDGESILDHLATVWPAGEGRMSYQKLAEHLTTAWPVLYPNWEGRQVSAALRPHGLATVDVNRSARGDGNRKGLRFNDLQTAITERDEPDPLENDVEEPDDDLD